ncbi:hypothetical protein B0T16DRAFT_408543 [Cercophora newfieldiana]|uniref:Uncharacterized protein n=1 Tax=Cercophora newfieldiana TaxID=92897 RepID=A0AA40CTN1_9PEZI|nr:hypothetical protein B0T16DRAFT_408543 [Cercophora newfieldiana]
MHLISIVVAALLTAPLSIAETIAPSPAVQCAQATATSKVTCPMGSGCCVEGRECCGGGCCPIGAICINKGRGDEACCPLDDATTCGIKLPTLTRACDASDLATTSVTCTAAETSWPCPPGNSCGVRFGACFAIANTCTGSAGGVTPTAPPSGGNPTASGGGGAATTVSQSSSKEVLRGSGAWAAVALGAAVMVAVGGFVL